MPSLRNMIKGIIPLKLLELYKNRKRNTRYLKFIQSFTSFSNGFKKGVFTLFSSTQFTSSLYYVLFSSSFRRENQYVLKGKLEYIRALNQAEGNSFLLRRNIHRLEKGLLMKPRRPVFAVDYISETVDAYININKSLHDISFNVDHGLIKWSSDVLESYFSIIGENEIVDKAKKSFETFKEADTTIEVDDVKYIPYERSLKEAKLKIPNFDQFLELTKFRRSVRWFEDKPVPRELIDKAIEAAVYAPSACNRQPFEFRVLDDFDLVQEAVKLPNGTAGYSQNVPVLIVVVGKLDAYFSERDRHLIYIDSALASMGLVFALETMGLSSCCINWPDIEKLEKRMSTLLKLSNTERPVMCLALGYPDSSGKVAYSKKKSLNKIRRYNYEY